MFSAVLSCGLFGCRAGNPAFMGLDDPDSGFPTPIRAPTLNLLAGLCPNDRDLVACLRFEGNAIDESRAALMTESIDPLYQPGPDGLALSVLLARQTRVTVGPSPTLVVQTVTVEAQINPRRLPGPGERAAIVDDPFQFSLFLYEGGGVRCSAAGGEMVLPGVIQTGIWTSLACSSDGKMNTLWVNGKARVSFAATGVPQHLTATFWVGENERGGTIQTRDRFDGLIDNVRVWRRLRSGAEICRDVPSCRP